ncbi:MAG: Uma2 family endonuclease [Terracidiphilus sp.]
MSTLPRFEMVPLPRSLAVDPPLSDEEFEAFCLKNEDLRIERTIEGAIRMNPPTGALTGDGNSEINHQLRSWWHTHNLGRVFDSNAGFFLPDGSMLSPDASYVLPQQLEGITKAQLAGILRLCPAFVIELLSPSDSLAETGRKMQRWIANGAQLGWLIDPYQQRVVIYEPGSEPRTFTGQSLEGSGPVQGFSLELRKVWRCYQI